MIYVHYLYFFWSFLHTRIYVYILVEKVGWLGGSGVDLSKKLLDTSEINEITDTRETRELYLSCICMRCVLSFLGEGNVTSLAWLLEKYKM